MKTGILTTSFPNFMGDVKGIFVYNLAKCLVNNNVETIVIAPFEKQSRNKNEEINGIKIRRFSYFIRKFQTLSEGSIADNIKNFYGKIQIPFFSFFYLLKAMQNARNVDLFHCQWALPSGFVGFIIKKIYNKPYIITTRGADLLLSVDNFLWKKLLLITLRNADYITSNNEMHIKELKKFVDSNKLILVPNGLDYDLYKENNKLKIRNKLKLNNSKIILFAGFLIERKKVDVLIKVFSNLRKKHNDLKLLIVGDGPLSFELKNLASSLDLKDDVIFTGSVDPKLVVDYMNASDVFVLPSNYEGRPNVIIEAMACKLPVVTTNVGDVSKLIKNGKEGFIVRNEKEMEKAVEKLLIDKKLREKFINNAFKSVRKNNPNWDECAKEFIKIYNMIV